MASLVPVGEDGLADLRLASALAGHLAAPTTASRAQVLAALAGARVFVAITATSTAEHVEAGTGLRAESSAEMALLSLVGSAGGRAVPLFLDAGAAVAFRPGARPVPLLAAAACGAALDDGAVAVLLDPPGAALAVSGPDLVELAAGRVPISGTALSSRRTTTALTTPTGNHPRLVAALTRALEREQVDGARLLEGPDGLVLGVTGDLDAPALAALAARVQGQVRGALPAAGLDVAVVPPQGPGLPLVRGSRPVRGWLRRGWLRRGWLRRVR